MIPWYLKIPAKLVLARLPVPRSFLNRLGIFRHGCMADSGYVERLVQGHAQRSGIDLAGKTVLELGPGDSVGSGIACFALGAQRTILVDAGFWATRDIEFYRRLVEWLANVVPDPARLNRVSRSWNSFEELLEAYQIAYLTEGLASLRSLDSETVDFCFSEAVLEHVRVDDYPATIDELYRVMKPLGTMSHLVDYKDHLQASLHNMRFSKNVWESRLFADSGFYTNRLRHVDVLRVFKDAGFELLSEKLMRWSSVPIKRSAIHSEFRRYSDEELMVRESMLVLRRPAALR